MAERIVPGKPPRIYADFANYRVGHCLMESRLVWGLHPSGSNFWPLILWLGSCNFREKADGPNRKNVYIYRLAFTEVSVSAKGRLSPSHSSIFNCMVFP